MRTKFEIVQAILKQDFYQTDSGMYQKVSKALESKLTADELESLHLVLTMKTVESNDLAVKVHDMLNK
jgi:hypothetical protein